MDLCNKMLEALNIKWNRDAIQSHALQYEWDSQRQNLLEIYKKFM
jgi:hypothetical protein